MRRYSQNLTKVYWIRIDDNTFKKAKINTEHRRNTEYRTPSITNTQTSPHKTLHRQWLHSWFRWLHVKRLLYKSRCTLSYYRQDNVLTQTSGPEILSEEIHFHQSESKNGINYDMTPILYTVGVKSLWKFLNEVCYRNIVLKIAIAHLAVCRCMKISTHLHLILLMHSSSTVQL